MLAVLTHSLVTHSSSAACRVSLCVIEVSSSVISCPMSEETVDRNERSWIGRGWRVSTGLMLACGRFRYTYIQYIIAVCLALMANRNYNITL